MSVKCEAKTRMGTPCQGYAVNGSEFCFRHDPRLAEERLEASRKGGQQGKLAVLPTTRLRLRGLADLPPLLKQLLEWTLTGQVAPPVANACGYLLNTYLKATEAGELAERVARLEQAIEGRPKWAA